MNSTTTADSGGIAACAVDPSGHARRVLEFDKVLRAVAAHARTDGGRERVEGLLPSDDGDTVAAEHVVVGEVLRRLEEGASPWSFDGALDIRPAVRDAVRPGAVLDAGELRRVAATLDVAGRLRRGLDAQPDRWPHLLARTAHLGAHDTLVKAIHAVLDERGELRDSASPALRAIRRELMAGRDALRARLESLLQKTGAASDPYVTLRGERYVVPVRAEMAGSVRGIVHDRSATGQTLFVEPLDAVDANNDLQRLRDAEQREVRRILQELTGRVAADAARIEPSLDAMDTLDAIQARASWAHANGAHAPQWGARVVLRAARHPLLDAQLRAAGHAVVPLDLEMSGARALVITGPNTGGKTVALKTVGVLSLLAQAGVPIPAAPDSELPVFTRVVADIGDEQSIEAAESTFSSHVHHVVEAVHAAGSRTLVVVDELMAGTDPEEGAALARVVLRWLADRGGVTLVTTHLSDLKLFAHSEPGLANAGMAFDPDSRTPLYRLQVGVPGSSNAIATAARLGLPAELLDAARRARGDAAGRLEAALTSLEAERAQMAAARARAQSAETEAQRIREEYAELHGQLAAKRRTASEDARREAARLVADAKARIEQVVRDLRSRDADRDSIHAAHETVRQLEAATQPVAEAAAPLGDAARSRPPVPGDRVWVRGLLREGILEEVDAGGRARVRLGNVPFAVAFADLDRLGDAAPERPQRGGYAAPETEPQPARLDVRGMERADALAALEQFLDRAVLHGSAQLEIVHGKGTGVLRRTVQELLARHPDVAEFRLGAHGEGGSGVTVVKLR